MMLNFARLAGMRGTQPTRILGHESIGVFRVSALILQPSFRSQFRVLTASSRSFGVQCKGGLTQNNKPSKCINCGKCAGFALSRTVITGPAFRSRLETFQEQYAQA